VLSGAAALVLAALLQAPPQQAPPRPEGSLSAARALLQQGRLNEAEQAVRSILAMPSLRPDARADAHFLLGYVLFRRVQARGALEAQGAHSEAAREGAKASLQEYAEGAKSREPGAFDLKIAALDQILLEDYGAADKLLALSLGRDPTDADAWYVLGRTKYNENRFAEAASAFEGCLKLEPRNAKAEDNLGLAYAGLGRGDDAFAAYRNAIRWQAERGERNPGPYLNLGSLLLDQNRPGEAVAYLRQAVELAPAHARGHEQLGKAYLQLDQLPEARAALEQAVRLAPESAPLHFMLGQAYRKSGWLDKARAELERAAALGGSRSTPD
jgi:tetratricopeptide (TPR) repeat protein